MNTRPQSTARLLLAALIGLVAACGEREPDVPELTWHLFGDSSGTFELAAKVCTESARGRYRIGIDELPAGAGERHDRLARAFGDGGEGIDIVALPVAWTAEFAEAGWILPWSEQDARGLRAARLRAAVDSTTHEQRVWAAPFTTDAQLLWYRADLLPSPTEDWRMLIIDAQRYGQRGALQVNAARGEDLAAFFVSLLESAGGTVLGDKGALVSLSEVPTRHALAVMRRLGNSPAADPALATGRDNDPRQRFERGQAAILIDNVSVWTSLKSNAPDLAPHVGWARWPRVLAQRPSRVVVGGVNIAVGAHTALPDLAFEAANCLASETNQRAAAVRGGLAPTIAALYDDPDVRGALPFADLLRETLRDAVQRPQTPRYRQVSRAISDTLTPMRDIQPGRDAERLHDRIRDALRSGEPH